MTDGNGNGHEPAETPESLRGRFKLIPADHGGAFLGWATDLCDRCLNCQCGNQREPFDLTPQGAMKTFLRLRQMQKDGFGK